MALSKLPVPFIAALYYGRKATNLAQNMKTDFGERQMGSTVTNSVLSIALCLLLVFQQAGGQQAPPPGRPGYGGQGAPLSAEELQQLTAPIALYPDALLSEILMASTYPLEVIEADRWAEANKNLKGDALKAAVDKQSWDDSVKSLTATPDVLDMMSNQLSWTQQLGDAVLAQQPDVMDAIQRLRQKAQANDKLKSTNEQTVTVQQEGDRQIIAIAPTAPTTPMPTST